MNLKNHSFLHNSFFNFFTQIFLTLITFLFIPYFVTKLGSERFGALTILWMFLGYFSFFDLGVGQAVIKFMSECLARADRQMASQVLWAAGKVGIALGIVGTIIILSASFAGVDSYFDISIILRHEVKQSLLLIAFSIPAVILQSSFRGVLCAFNQFDTLNIILAFSGILQWGGSAFVLFLDGSLIDVMVLTLCIKYCILILFLLHSVKLLPEFISQRQNVGKTYISELLKFGGWVSISQLLAPLFSFFERSFIAALLSLSWVTFYSVPNDGITRLLVIPMSLVSTLYPVLSGGWTTQEKQKEIKLLYQRSIKYVYLVMLLIASLLFLFSYDILSLWLGKEFAIKSTPALMIFSVGVIFNSLAQLPNASLQAFGKPEVPSKLLILELPFYLIGLYFLTKEYGIYGTAVAWFLRVTIEAVILFFLNGHILSRVISTFDISYLWKAFIIIIIGAIIVILGRIVAVSMTLNMLLMALFCFIYALGIWFFAIDDNDKRLVIGYTQRLTNKFSVIINRN